MILTLLLLLLLLLLLFHNHHHHRHCGLLLYGILLLQPTLRTPILRTGNALALSLSAASQTLRFIQIGLCTIPVGGM